MMIGSINDFKEGGGNFRRVSLGEVVNVGK